MTEETKYSKVKNESTPNQINEALKNALQINGGPSTTSTQVELIAMKKQHNEEETKYEDIDHEQSNHETPDNQASNKHKEENNEINKREIKFCPCCKYHKQRDKTMGEKYDEKLELETCCHDNCCIKKVKKNDIRPYDGYDKQTTEEKNKIVARLGEDVWALGYVLARKRKRLPCSFAVLLCSIYSVQVLILFAMIWGNSGLPFTNKPMDIQGHCQIEFRDTINGTNVTNPTPYDFSTQFPLNNADMWCQELSTFERVKRRQTWSPEHYVMRDFKKDSSVIFEILSGFTVFVFPFTEILSFILLGFYIASSMINPIIFFIVAHEYNQVKLCIFAFTLMLICISLDFYFINTECTDYVSSMWWML